MDSVPWVHGICLWGRVQDSHSAETKHICSKSNLLYVCTHYCFTSWYDLVMVSGNDTLPSIKIRITPRRDVHSIGYEGGVSNRQTMWRTLLGAKMLWTPCQADNLYASISQYCNYSRLLWLYTMLLWKQQNPTWYTVYIYMWLGEQKPTHPTFLKMIETEPDIVLATADRASV